MKRMLSISNSPISTFYKYHSYRLYTFFLFLLFFFIICCTCCSDETYKSIKIFKEDNKFPDTNFITDTPVKFAIAPVISPKSSMLTYSRLVQYLSKKINQRVEPIYPKSYLETNTALKNGLCDIALICTGAYLKESSSGYMDIVAVPVKSGKSFYNAYIIVNNESGIMDFKQLRGKVFAFTDPLSLTGYYYIAYKLRELGYKPSDYFSKIVWTKSHDRSIRLVAERFVDGASVDSIVYEAISSSNSDYIKATRIIERSMDLGIPPIVARSDISVDLRNKMQNVFLNMEFDEDGRDILKSLEIDRFIKPDRSIYESAKKIMRRLGEID